MDHFNKGEYMNRTQLEQMLADMKAALNQQKAPQTVETATKVF